MRASLIFSLYRLLQWIGIPVLAIYLSVRCARERRYLGSLRERLGFLPRSWEETGSGAIWLHAVSVGEVLTAVKLLGDLRRAIPGVQLWVSVSTLAGRELARERLRGVADGVFYAPLDYCGCVRRVLRKLRPHLVIVTETEIWPNLWRESRRAGARLLVVNGRISDRAFPRYRRLRAFFGEVLPLADLILAQGSPSEERYLALGAPRPRVVAGGNLKYDFDPGQTSVTAEVRRLIEAWRPGKIWIAASTMPPAAGGDVDEDDIVLEAFETLAQRWPGLLTILAPRRPERFGNAAAKLAGRGIRFIRRSQLGAVGTAGAGETTVPGHAGPGPALPAVLLLDSIGELSSVFPLADVVFMGGTLARRGGHNILEPAFFARPVIAGPHMENFPDIAAEFERERAVVRIAGGADGNGPSGGSEPGAGRQARFAAELALTVETLLRDPGQTGERARKLAESRRGATQRAVAEAARLFSLAAPLRRNRASALLLPLAGLWHCGTLVQRWRHAGRVRRLGAPVISVGAITVGGAGKTPLVLWLAAELARAGLRPAFLTRGYRRKSPERVTVIEAGATAPVTRTGDEGQILVRSGLGPAGISANRFAAGAALEERFAPGVFLLDDGFQHRPLHRDADVVVLDSLDPFGGGWLIPAGRLREMPSALARASAIVLTRCEPGRSYEGLVAGIRRWNAAAPIFQAANRPRGWRDTAGREIEVSGPVAAFCGLGNPRSFWRTLDQMGCRVVRRWAFADHHHYRPTEIRRMATQAAASGAQFLVTTQKDAANLPAEATVCCGGGSIAWLAIETVVKEGDRLVEFLLDRLGAGLAPRRG